MEDSIGIAPGLAAAAAPKARPRWRALGQGIAAKELSPAGFLAFAGFTCVVIWAVVWAYVAAFPMAYQDRNYPLWLAKAQLAGQCRPDDVAVFGDSRAVAGIMPKAMGIAVTNLASPGASPIENYFLVKRLLRCPVPPRLVVLAQSAGLYTGPHAFWNIYAHTGILSLAETRQVQAQAERLHDDELYRMPHPTGVPYALLPELYASRFPPLYVGNLMAGYVVARQRYNQAVLRDVVADSGHLLFGNAPGSDDVADEGSDADWRVTPLTDIYLQQTLAMLQAHHVKVAIVTMPVNQATCRQMPAVVQTRLANYLAGMARSYPDVVLLRSQIDCWPDRDFNDDAHFNAAGALAYSKQFKAEIQPVLTPTLKMQADDER